MINEENGAEFANMPSPPEDLFERMRGGFKKYLFFARKENGERDFACTNCREYFLIKKVARTVTPEEAFLSTARHGTVASCPKCKYSAEVKNVRICRTERLSEFRNIAVVLPASHDEVWIRCFRLENEYGDLSVGAHNNKEWMRYRLTPGKAEYWMWSNYHGRFLKEKNIVQPFEYFYGIFFSKEDYDLIDANGLPVNLAGTFLQYNGRKLNSGYYGGGCPDDVRWLCEYARHPQLEMLLKMKHYDVISELINYRKENVSVIDWSASKPWDLYRMTRIEYNDWQKSGGNFDVLKVYKRIHGKDRRDLEYAKRIIAAGSRSKWSHNIGGAFKLIATARKLKADPREMIRYLEKVQRDMGQGCHQCPGVTVHQVATQWADYIDMAGRLGKLKEISPFPKDLYAEHDRLLMIFKERENYAKIADKKKMLEKIKQDSEKEAVGIRKRFPRVEKIYQKIEKKYVYKSGEYEIRVPQSIAEIIEEGKVLEHCIARVDRYYDRITRQESYLMFLRRTENPEMPFYTLEVEPGGTIRQKRTIGDRQGPDLDKALPFLAEWQQEVQKRLTESDKRRAKISAETREKDLAELRQNKTIVRTGFLTGKLLADVLAADLLEVDIKKENKKQKEA